MNRAKWLVCMAAIAGCRAPSREVATTKQDAAAPSATASNKAPDEAVAILRVHAPVKARERSPAKADESIDIAAHRTHAGSTPGDLGRDPATEPRAYDVQLGAYAIDALPYPNDPMQPSKAGASLAEAEKLCEARGERLCSELEWESACKGPDEDAYATGASWDGACDRDPSSCPSAYGVRALGATLEWTSSRTADGGAPVLRGAARGELAAARRCAHRTRASSASPGAIAFRCCRGEPNDAPLPAIADHALTPFRPMAIDAVHLSAIFATIPELASFADGLRYFDDAEVARRSDASALRAGLTLSGTPLLWSPEPGAELLVASGLHQGPEASSFVVALWTVGDDAYRLAASFIMKKDPVPVVLAYDPRVRAQLLWTSCFACNGEQGTLRIGDGHRVLISQD